MSARISLLILLAVGSAGCETFGPNQCDDSIAANPLVVYTGGATQDGVYMSSPWTGPLLAFPGGQRYALVHDLPSEPAWILTYLSFDADGTADGGSLAQSTGNQAEVVGVDDLTVQIANDSCSSYYVLVVAGVGATPPGSP